MKIPRGSAFSLDFSGGLLSLLGAWTPFTLYFSDDLRITPELDFGLALVGGDYEIDAGRARGSAVYQNPPVDFVVGGKSSSLVGAGAPMVGVGGELRVGPDDWVQWVTHASLGYFAYDGDTKLFTGSSRAKDLDIDYLSLSLDTALVLPMTDETCLTVGARAQYMRLEGSIKSKRKDAATIVAMRERFDKDIDFKVLSALLYVGVTF